MHNDDERKESLTVLLDQLSRTTEDQLSLQFDDMNSISGQSALTISSSGIDTITLDSFAYGASGSNYNYSYSNITGANGPSNSIYTTGTGGVSLGLGQIVTNGTSPYTITPGLTWSDFGNVNPGALQVKGDAEFDGDVKLKGKSLNETLENIEKRLNILRPNPELEEKWDELKELGEKYRALEADIIEKQKMWDILKK